MTSLLRFKVFLHAALAGPLVLAGGTGWAQGAASDAKVAVETAEVQPQPIDNTLDLVGTLRADEAVTVRPEIAGRIDRIEFEEGAPVRAGQRLFSLDAALLRADVQEAEANLRLSQRAYNRAEELAGKRLIAAADVDSARANLAVDQARLASARTRLEKSVIQAPFNGIIGLRQISVGEYVQPGQALVDLVRIDPIELDTRVPEVFLTQLAVGQPITVRVDTFPGERFDGQVIALAPQVDIDTRSIAVRARIANPEGRLRPGLFARVGLVLEHKPQALLIPEQAIWPVGERKYVFRVQGGVAHQVEVNTGLRRPGLVEVVSGLAAGDIIVTAGQMNLGEGTPVEPVSSAGSPASPASAPSAKATQH